MKKLVLLLHHAGTAPDLIYPSLDVGEYEVYTYYIKSDNNLTLNKLYDEIIGTIGPGFECMGESDMEEKVISMHKDVKFDGVLTFAEMLLESQAKIAAECGLKYMPLSVIQNVQNKKTQRDILKTNGVPVPHYYEMKITDEVSKLPQFDYPVVFKPNYGGGGYYIDEANNFDELSMIIREAKMNAKNIIYSGRELTFNIEERVIGVRQTDDLNIAPYGSVESLVINNEIIDLAITDRTNLVFPFRETGFINPSNLDGSYKKELVDIAHRAIKALELNNTVVHTEIIYSEKGPMVLEVNARAGGTFPFRLKIGTDGQYDLFRELANLALGEDVNRKVEWERNVASKIVHCLEKEEKVITEFDISKTTNLEGVDLAIPIAFPGKKVFYKNGIEDLLALYYLSSSSRNELIKTMYEIDNLISVKYE